MRFWFVFIVGLIVLGAVFLQGASAIEKCSYEAIDTLPSPTGKWSIQRTRKYCPSDTDASPILFSLLPAGGQFNKKNIFLMSTDYEKLRYDPLSIFAKWIDDDNLLIAAPEGSQLRAARRELKGINIQYAVYPLASENTKDEPLRQQVKKKVNFEARFRVNHGVGLPGIGCRLEISARDENYVDQLILDLTARKTFAIKATDVNGKEVLAKAYSAYDFQIRGVDEIERPDKHATSAEVVGFAPKEGKSTLWDYDLGNPGAKAPNGMLMHKWDFVYTPKEPRDLITIANKIKMNNLAIRVSYWLDNVDVVYFGKQIDQTPIQQFEQCINDNHIFDTPL